MATKKTTAKAEEKKPAAKAAETAKVTEEKKAPAKTEAKKAAPAKKETAKKETAKAAPAKKETKKAAPAKKETAKTAPAKKETKKAAPAKKETKKAEQKETQKTTKKNPVEKQLLTVAVKGLFFEYGDKQVDASTLAELAKADFKANGGKGAIRGIELYVKAEDNALYYVINGKENGKVEL